MGLSTVQKKVKLLVKMGWITATSVRKPASKEISHTIYTVKDPEVILAELNAGLSQQGDMVVTIAKNQKVKTEESGKNEQKPFMAEPAAPAAGKPDGVPVVAHGVDASLPANDAVTGRNVVEFPRQRASFKSVAPDDEEFDEDGQPLNKWADFDLDEKIPF